MSIKLIWRVVNFLIIIIILTNYLPSNAESYKNEDIFINQKQIDNAYRFNVNGLIYLHLEGNASQIGFQHGSLLALEIVDLITRISNIIHNNPIFHIIEIDHNSTIYEKISKLWWNFLRNQINKIYWDRFPDDYKIEIKGIAKGVQTQGIKVHGKDVDYIDILTINQYTQYMSKVTSLNEGFHPLRFFYNSIKNLIPNKQINVDKFINVFADFSQFHHCSAFIATGDATTNGQIVVSQELQIGAWWIPYYSEQRCNVIIDIIPSTGYRFMMSTGPGQIWSGENYYQNEKGIVLVDTTAPQGLWTNRGYSMAIRTRRAAQYSSSIDDALFFLKDKNDGVWSAVYLLGDIKTGEIVRFEQALYNSKEYRKSDGYFWSANNAEDIGVRAEAYGFSPKDIITRFKNRLLSLKGIDTFEYTTFRYTPRERDKKFEELGDKYYGVIDTEIVKNKIMNEEPICNRWASDLKVSDTNLINNNSFWEYWGNCGENIWNISFMTNNLIGEDGPPVGWVLVNGMPEKHNYKIPINNYEEESGNYELTWKYDFSKNNSGKNAWFANLIQCNNSVFAAASNGIVYSINIFTGKINWKQKINNYDNYTCINAKGDKVFLGLINESLAVEANTGEIIWRNNQTTYLYSKSVILDDKIFFGSRYGDIYALNITNGKLIWSIQLTKYTLYLTADEINNGIIATCGERCYSINSDNGNIIWDFKIDGLILSSAKIFENNLYFGSTNTNIYAIDAENGELKWKNKTGWSIQSTPDVLENIVYTGSMDHNLYAFDANNGKNIWSFTCNAAIRSAPFADGEFVFFGCDDGRFYMLNRTDGTLIWHYAPGFTIEDDIHNYVTTSIVSDCIVINKQVLISANGEIFCLSFSKND